MKKLILCFLLFGFLSPGHSQVLLDETKVEYRKESMRLDPNTHQLALQISEEVAGEFEKDPLSYVKNNIDIKEIISANKNENYNEYIVNLISRKGHLEAYFNRNGELKSSVQQFKNIRIPEVVRLQVEERYGQAPIVGTWYYASTKGWDIKKSYFRVKIKDGKKTKRMRIDRGHERLASK